MSQNEEIMQQEETVSNTMQETDLLRKFFHILKRNFIFIAIILILSGVCGYILGTMQIPVYSASVKHVYFVRVPDSVTSNESYYNTSLTGQYHTTIADFVDEPVVLNRANYYYDYYLNNKEAYANRTNGTKGFQGFLEDLEEGLIGGYDSTVDYVKKGYIVKDSVRVSTGGDDTNKVFTITIGYTDLVAESAKQKVKILSAAVRDEANKPDESEVGLKYYFGVNVYLEDIDNEYNRMGVSVYDGKANMVTKALIVGVVIAVAFVYLRSVLDNTMKDKQELEMITGSNLLAYISDREN